MTPKEIEAELRRVIGALSFEVDKAIADDVYRRVHELIRQAALPLDAERARVRVLREALAGVCGDEPLISDLTNGYPWAGCSYCHGPHYHSAYHKRLKDYRGLVGEEPLPEPGEDDYAPFTEHNANCPWAAGRAALAAVDGEVTP